MKNKNAEQPAQQEPVAKYMGKTYRCPIVNLYQDIPVGTLLYATPAQRKPLTNDKYEAIVEDIADWNRYVEVDTAHQSLEKHVREVLTAHGIKENT